MNEDFEWLKKNHPATMMRGLIDELRENIRQSGNPVSRQLLDKLNAAWEMKTVSGANQIFQQVAAQHRQYLEGNT